METEEIDQCTRIEFANSKVEIKTFVSAMLHRFSAINAIRLVAYKLRMSSGYSFTFFLFYHISDRAAN